VALRDGPNRLYRNDGGGSFTDVSSTSGIDDPRRSVGAVWFDGNLDLFVANYGPNAPYRFDGGAWVNVASDLGLAIDSRWDSCAWGDFDHDGDLDLYVNGTVSGGVSYPDYLFRNDGSRFRRSHRDPSANRRHLTVFTGSTSMPTETWIWPSPAPRRRPLTRSWSIHCPEVAGSVRSRCSF
jgi:hypothetical protein